MLAVVLAVVDTGMLQAGRSKQIGRNPVPPTQDEGGAQLQQKAHTQKDFVVQS